MKHTQPLTLTTPDADGYVPDLSLKGLMLKHTGNGKVYRITTFTWMGAEDRWGYIHHETGIDEPVAITRPVRHLHGYRDDGTERYMGMGR